MTGSSKKPWYLHSKSKSRSKPKNGGQLTVTKWEDRLATILKRNGIEYQRQVRIRKYSVDFLIPPNVIVEVTGSVHKVRLFHDLRRSKELETWGYRVVVIPNHMLLADDANEAVLYKINNP